MSVSHQPRGEEYTFGTLKLKDSEGKNISWDYIENLHQIQKSEVFHLANKIKKITYSLAETKNKVNLAAQVISSSVADAIEFCNQELHLPEFKNSEGTVKFLRVFDKLFDVLNSRNPFGSGLKAPMRLTNRERWMSVLSEAEEYILGLKDDQGQQMYQHKRKKTGFLGFLLNINSVKEIFQQYVGSENAPLKYLLMYKLSQDHLELFFSAVRSKGGFNNNPTVLQFKTAYKWLLMRHHIKSTGNCIPIDETQILNVSDGGATVGGAADICTKDAEKYNLIDNAPAHDDHDYADVPDIRPLSEFKAAAIGYIAGYVVKMVRKKTHCVPCQEALVATDHISKESSLFLVKRDRGGLIHASESVIRICSETEKCFQQLQKTKRFFPKHKPMPLVISTAVLHNISHSLARNEIFHCLEGHMFDTVVEDNHVYKLIKLISQCYSTIRFHHVSKLMNEEATGEKIRKQLSRLIVFKHQ